jgi:hypothetical protein
VIQDGRDGVAPQSADVPGQARRWRERLTQAREDGATLRHYLEVRYEQVALDPEPALREMCAFLGLEFDARLLEGESNRGRRKQTDLIGRWADVLSRSELLAFEQAAGETLASLGYPVLASRDEGETRAHTCIRLGARRERAGDFQTAEQC